MFTCFVLFEYISIYPRCERVVALWVKENLAESRVCAKETGSCFMGMPHCGGGEAGGSRSHGRAAGDNRGEPSTVGSFLEEPALQSGAAAGVGAEGCDELPTGAS